MATYYVRQNGSDSNTGTGSNTRVALGFLVMDFKKVQVNMLKVGK